MFFPFFVFPSSDVTASPVVRTQIQLSKVNGARALTMSGLIPYDHVSFNSLRVSWIISWTACHRRHVSSCPSMLIMGCILAWLLGACGWAAQYGPPQDFHYCHCPSGDTNSYSHRCPSWCSVLLIPRYYSSFHLHNKTTAEWSHFYVLCKPIRNLWSKQKTCLSFSEGFQSHSGK